MKVPGQVCTEGTHNLKKIYPSYKNFCEANISGFSHAINGKIFIQVSNVFIAGRSVAFTKANFRISIRTHIRTRAFNSINVLFGAENHGIQLDWLLKFRKKTWILEKKSCQFFALSRGTNCPRLKTGFLKTNWLPRRRLSEETEILP